MSPNAGQGCDDLLKLISIDILGLLVDEVSSLYCSNRLKTWSLGAACRDRVIVGADCIIRSMAVRMSILCHFNAQQLTRCVQLAVDCACCEGRLNRHLE